MDVTPLVGFCYSNEKSITSKYGFKLSRILSVANSEKTKTVWKGTKKTAEGYMKGVGADRSQRKTKMAKKRVF